MKKFLIISLVLNLVLCTALVLFGDFSSETTTERVLKNLNKKAQLDITLSVDDIAFYYAENYDNPFGETDTALVVKICNPSTKENLNNLIATGGWKDLSSWDDETRDIVLGGLDDAKEIKDIGTEITESCNSKRIVPNSNNGYAFLFITDEYSSYDDPHRYILVEYLDYANLLYIYAHNTYL
ncbi:MAG: hypothetical protein E7531_05135 [Ruminococcaceae bacterium]|nr:hypothetical protein [Oscillospiraceae bacterium]